MIDVGLVHLPEELSSIGTQGLDVASLTFGVDRVKRERRLAAAREAGDDDELIARNLDRDIFEVIFPRANDDNLILSHESEW